jgi:hypothetical protein
MEEKKNILPSTLKEINKAISIKGFASFLGLILFFALLKLVVLPFERRLEVCLLE